MVNLFSSESRTINERRDEQEGRKHRRQDGSIDETKYVIGNKVHLSCVAYPCTKIIRVVGQCTVQLLLNAGVHCTSASSKVITELNANK